MSYQRGYVEQDPGFWSKKAESFLMIGTEFENNPQFSLCVSGLVLVESQPLRAGNAGRDMRLAHSFS